MNSKQRLARKKKAQKAIQAQFLCPVEGQNYVENYLLRMRHDTKFLAENPVISKNFNVAPSGGADPFLTQMSIAGKVVAGNDIRALKNRSSQQSKRVLHFTQDETNKARSCEEMLMFEKPDETRDKEWPVYACKAPSLQMLIDFEEGLNQLIKDTEAGITSQALNVSN